MNLNKERMGEKNYNKAMQDAISHLVFCLEIYHLQEQSGRYYLHEHPASATSWSRPELLEFLLHSDAEIITSDMCMYGMTSQGKPPVPHESLRPSPTTAPARPRKAGTDGSTCAGSHVA